MNWSWKECNRILYWPWQILTQIWKKLRLGMFLSCSYFFWDFRLDVLVKGVLIKKKGVMLTLRVEVNLKTKSSIKKYPFLKSSHFPSSQGTVETLYNDTKRNGEFLLIYQLLNNTHKLTKAWDKWGQTNPTGLKIPCLTTYFPLTHLFLILK